MSNLAILNCQDLILPTTFALECLQIMFLPVVVIMNYFLWYNDGSENLFCEQELAGGNSQAIMRRQKSPMNICCAHITSLFRVTPIPQALPHCHVANSFNISKKCIPSSTLKPSL